MADALARRSRRGAQITVIVDPDPLSTRALEGLRGLRLQRFEAVLIVLPTRPPEVTHDRWMRDIERLVALLTIECAEKAPAFIYGSSAALASASAGRTTERPPGDSASPCTTPPATRVRFRELPPQPSVLGSAPPFSPVTYESWADLIVDRLDLEIAELRAAAGASRAGTPAQDDDEVMRRTALQTLQLSAGEPDEALKFLLRQAKVAFACAGAALVIVDSEHVRPHAAVGAAPPALTRDTAYSSMVIQSDRPVVVSDAHADPRAPRDPATGRRGSTRFYAGYPVHTWDGYRIGALCIYDDHPRDVGIFDLVQLWEIAGQVEQHLWTRALSRGARPGYQGRPVHGWGLPRAAPSPSPSRWSPRGALSRTSKRLMARARARARAGSESGSGSGSAMGSARVPFRLRRHSGASDDVRLGDA
ncbi:MAG: GAF domain-containing protein [Amnibacterium sp.]